MRNGKQGFETEREPFSHRRLRSLRPLSPFALPFRVFTVALAVCASTVQGQAPVRVLTFNIRYGTADDGDHRWPNRKNNVITTIRDHAPHILGIQEALRSQLDEIARAVPGYRELGVGRDDGKTAGEYAALLVDTARFTIVADGHFWYSDTPNVAGSKNWGNNVTRICTWARIVDKTNGDTIRVYNSHWDHESQPSREKSAALLINHIATDNGRRDRVLVLADFNSDEENEAFKKIVSDPRADLHDTFRELHPDALNVGTYHGFKGDSTGGKIDAILVSRGWTTVDAMIDHRKFGPLWASDHFAVTATLRGGRGLAGGVATFAAMPADNIPLSNLSLHAFADVDNDNNVDGLFAQASGSNKLFDRRGPTLVENTRYKLPAVPVAAAAWRNITRPEFPPIDRFPDLALALVDGGIKIFHNRGADLQADPTLRWSGLEEMTRTGIDVRNFKARMLTWLDYDGDWDNDLFVAFADHAPMIFAAKTASGAPGSVQFTDESGSSKLSGAKPFTVGAWMDYDLDGDLDLIAAGPPGLENALYRNNGRPATGSTTFELIRGSGIEWAGRDMDRREQKLTAICIADVNNDGLFDIFFANHGRNALFLGRGGAGAYDDESRAWNVGDAGTYDACAFGDFDNDGKPDLFLSGGRDSSDVHGILYRNLGDRFSDVTPDAMAALRNVQAAQWTDIDHDGDLDLIVDGNSAPGGTSVLENKLEGDALEHAIDVRVRDIQDYMTLTGAEVRVFARGDKLISSGIVGDGSNGGSQSDMPLHLATGDNDEVDVEVTYPKGDTRVQMKLEGISVKAYRERGLTMRVPPSGKPKR